MNGEVYYYFDAGIVSGCWPDDDPFPRAGGGNSIYVLHPPGLFYLNTTCRHYNLLSDWIGF
jgi:hypothetical protein